MPKSIKHTIEKNSEHGCSIPGTHSRAMCETLVELPTVVKSSDQLPTQCTEDDFAKAYDKIFGDCDGNDTVFCNTLSPER